MGKRKLINAVRENVISIDFWLDFFFQLHIRSTCDYCNKIGKVHLRYFKFHCEGCCVWYGRLQSTGIHQQHLPIFINSCLTFPFTFHLIKCVVHFANVILERRTFTIQLANCRCISIVRINFWNFCSKLL